MLIHINIGSNQNRSKNIKQALSLLQQEFGKLDISNIYESSPVGFIGDNFYNLGVNFQSNLSAKKIIQILHNIEDNIGRDRTSAKFSARTIDLDLVLYGDKIDKKLNIPRGDILRYSFVLKPLQELSPLLLHPILQETYQDLWRCQGIDQK